MNEQEMLALAASVAGRHYQPGKDWHDQGQFYVDGRSWNALTDDGDAFRLAVKLKISVYHEENRHFAEYEDEVMDMMITMVEESDDERAATRLVIVAAAAELAKNIQ